MCKVVRLLKIYSKYIKGRCLIGSDRMLYLVKKQRNFNVVAKTPWGYHEWGKRL